MKPAALLATLFLSLVAVLQLLRLVLQWEFIIGGLEIPMWASVLAVIGAGAHRLRARIALFPISS